MSLKLPRAFCQHKLKMNLAPYKKQINLRLNLIKTLPTLTLHSVPGNLICLAAVTMVKVELCSIGLIKSLKINNIAYFHQAILHKITNQFHHLQSSQKATTQAYYSDLTRLQISPQI